MKQKYFWSTKDKRDIEEYLRQGLSVKEIAERYGISRQRMYRVIKYLSVNTLNTKSMKTLK